MLFCVVGAGTWAWSNTGNILLTILAILVGGFVGSLIGFQIHQTRRMRELGFTSRRELNAFDRDMRDLRCAIAPGIEAETRRRRDGAWMQGNAAFHVEASEGVAEQWENPSEQID